MVKNKSQNRLKNFSKIQKVNRSQSEVITTVLLILIVIASIVIVMNFVIPFVQKQLKGGDCFNVLNKVQITSSDRYNCYNDTTVGNGRELYIQVHTDDVSDKIQGFSLEVGGASTKTFKIVNNTKVSGILNYDRSEFLLLPGNNEERTYIIKNQNNLLDSRPDKIQLYAVLTSGEVCSSSSSLVDISTC